MTNDVTASHT